MLSQDEADGNRAPLLISDDSVSSDEIPKLLDSDPDAKDEQRKKTIRREQNQLMYDISRFASEGAQLSGNADESKDGSDGGAAKTKEDPKGTEPASAPAPAPAALAAPA